jgi:toxin-antitoxin system PIN domain toxin
VILPDVNLLIYAFRSDDPRHPFCKTWLDGVVAGDARFAVSKLALSAVVRITTNTRGYQGAVPLAAAFAFCDNILSQPHCVVLEPGEGHWGIFRGLCEETNTYGPRVTDAWYAALAIEWGCEWITFDRDFARFPGLKCTILPSQPA